MNIREKLMERIERIEGLISRQAKKRCPLPLAMIQELDALRLKIKRLDDRAWAVRVLQETNRGMI